MIEFRLRLKFIKDDLQAEITAKKSISEKDFEPLKIVINKAREKDVDLTPVAKFLKNKDVNNFLKNDWKIDDVEFILSAANMLAYYEQQKEEGGTISHAQKTKFPHVSTSEIHKANFELMMDNLITSCSMENLRGGYILPKYKEKHEKLLRTRYKEKYEKLLRTKQDNISNYDEKSNKTQYKKITLSKAECSRCRKSTIEKATMVDLSLGGFKPEFISSLNVKEQAYLESLSNLQIKFMMNAVTKKYKHD